MKHIITTKIITKGGEVYVHAEGCPACLAGVPPQERMP